jgi:hypothetical protein
MKNKAALSIYIGFSIFYLAITALNQEAIARFLKPFLLPLLLVAVYNSPAFTTKKLLRFYIKEMKF